MGKTYSRKRRVHIPSKASRNFKTVDRTISDARDVRVSPRGSDHAHERNENVVGNELDTDSMEFEVEGSMASGDEEEVVPSLELVMPNVERGAVQLAFR